MIKTTFLLPGYPWYPIGGYKVVYEYANLLCGMGYDVTIIHPKRMTNISIINDDLKKTSLAELAFNLIKKGSIYIKSYICTPSIGWQYIDDNVNMRYVNNPNQNNIPKADIIVATAWSTAEFVWSYPNDRGHKFYLIQHYETWAGPKERVDSTWMHPMNKIVIAKWLYDLGIEMGIPETEMRHIPNGIDQTKYYRINNKDVRQRRVAMLYSKEEWKGSPDGIEALKIAKARITDLKAVLFGTCSPPPNLPDWIEYYQNPTQDVLIKDIYNGSCVYLCPSWVEGWHLPPAEAMACGCAVVATDIGGVRDYAINNETALLSPIKNPALLAENLIKILENNDLLKQIACSGYNNIKMFTWEQSAIMLDKYLKEVLTK